MIYNDCPPINLKAAGHFNSQILVPLKQPSPIAIHGRQSTANIWRSLILFVAAQRAQPRETKPSGGFNPPKDICQTYHHPPFC